ncbi:uncharacterized protein LOC105285567 [Ooceraea biroi]|uniref:uncharacterized protein LOC105285567 n=1 Tax=Ooceraea biroi TaxID=2015173 RepID=UPI000F07FE53|nr:uncharacterized protein LOC105285567 [Ooceraea biroi]
MAATPYRYRLKPKNLDWKLTWGSPDDCTTITGSLYARIKIRTINDENFPIVKQTRYNSLSLKRRTINLFGGEQYVARVYVIRKANAEENSSAYQEIEFTTPPGIPPQVTNLDVYETDTREDQKVVYLRWQEPIPPLNGTLRSYSILLCTIHECSSTEVPLTNSCKLWNDYICGSAKFKIKNPTIAVVAHNQDVRDPGPPFTVSKEKLNNQIPEEPANFTVLPYNKGIVDLYWKHPWKTGSRLDHFYIMIIPLSTNLVKFLERNWRPYNSSINVTVTNYMREYTKRLYLHPSTQYHIFIKAVTVLGMSSTVQYKEFKTPSSLKFSGPLKYVMHDSMISLNIPRIVNYTKDSTIHVIVKGPLGPNGCKGYLRVPEDLQAIADIDVSHVAWEAAEISSQQDLNKSFTIGNNKMYGRAKNCQLQLKESYDITVIVTENNENSLIDPIMLKITVLNGEISSQPHHEAWLIPVILILIVAAVLLYLYRRVAV